MLLKSIAIATVLATFSSLGMVSSSLAAPPAKAFGELPVAYDAAISPNGEELAIIINIRGTYGVITQKMDGYSKMRITTYHAKKTVRNSL